VKLLAPAKINLHLRVAPVTGDGFHPLLSWMCTVGLFDTLLFEKLPLEAGPPETGLNDRLAATGASELGIRLRCDDPSLPCDGTNLVMRSARAMADIATFEASHRRTVGEDGLAIELHKRIPMGGGLGGGSSDAARVVLGLNRFWELNLPVDRLSAVSATLGSDVAFLCHGPSSVCSGRGQIVRPIAVPTPRWVLLILPTMAVPTGPVYRRFDELLSEEDRVLLAHAVATEPDWDRWRSLSAQELLPHLVNDLERPAFDLHPALSRLREELEQSLGRIVRMSGSGSSLFTLFDDCLAAEQAAEKINREAQCRARAVALAPRIDDDLASSWSGKPPG
jgi:4-diphosphocytidyl-2-C-methyl-D-erythritol kinase